MPIDRQDRVLHWRALAADAVTSAALATDEQSKSMLVNIASAYEKLAQRAETSNATVPTSTPVASTKP